MAIKLRPKQRLAAAMLISLAFFVTELAVAYKTGSLALMADSFHYMNDLLSFGVALGAIVISERKESPQWLSFGWQRAQILGAFFNGVFLLALGMSIFFQSIERFLAIRPVDNVKLILIMGCVGLALNIISAAFLHEHHGHSHCQEQETHEISAPCQQKIHENYEIGKPAHVSLDNSSMEDGGVEKKPTFTVETFSLEYSDSEIGMKNPKALVGHSSINGSTRNPASTSINQLTQKLDRHDGHHHPISGHVQSPSRDIGMMGVMIHVVGDAINNLGIIVASLFIWFMSSDTKYYADPAVSVGISFMIFITAFPLLKNSGVILLQGAPPKMDLTDIKHDIEKIPGIESVHELHVWRLDQRRAVASAHVVFSNDSLVDFTNRAMTVRECLHAYGIHSVTLQPELSGLSPSGSSCSLPSITSLGTGSTECVPVVQSSLPGSLARVYPRCRMACGDGGCEDLMCCRAD